MSNDELRKLSVSDLADRILTGEPDPSWLPLLRLDSRKGVQRIADRLEKSLERIQALESKQQRMERYEIQARGQGFFRIAGIDEVGRGPLAGPVVAAAVVLDPERPILGLDDSKRLSESERERLFALIQENALAIGVGQVGNERIDEINILNAAKEAMVMAVRRLGVEPDFLLIDAVELPIDRPQRNLIKGDQLSNSIAAASIVAKVIRDRQMVAFESTFPGYDFAGNKGYGTPRHYEGLKRLGMTSIHRRTFLKGW